MKKKGYYPRGIIHNYKDLRLMNLILSAIALSMGIIIYILFRDNHYLSCFSFLKISTDNIFTDFLKCYFADFLWAFSFCEALNGIMLPDRKKTIIIIGISVFVLGAGYEYCQLKNIFQGTFDNVDIVMYFCGVAISACFNLISLKNVRKST